MIMEIAIFVGCSFSVLVTISDLVTTTPLVPFPRGLGLPSGCSLIKSLGYRQLFSSRTE